MTKETAKAMLVAQRYAETRIAAEHAKTAANDLLHRAINLTFEDRQFVDVFVAFCETLEDAYSLGNAKGHVEGLSNG